MSRNLETLDGSHWHEFEPLDTFKGDIRGKERLCLEIKCPRCEACFIIEDALWSKLPLAYNLTRPCPYCWRASYLPGRQQVTKAEYQAAVDAAGRPPKEYVHPTAKKKS